MAPAHSHIPVLYRQQALPPQFPYFQDVKLRPDCINADEQWYTEAHRMIDDKDFSILKVLHDADKPLWKKEIHERIQVQSEAFPCDSFSIQTVGRRVDSLYGDDLITARIMSPAQAQRTLITTYQPTSAGIEAIKQYRDDFLRRQVISFVRSTLQDEEPPSQPCLGCLFSERFELDTETIQDNLTSTEILCLALAYFLQDSIEEVRQLTPALRTIQLEGQLQAPVEEYVV